MVNVSHSFRRKPFVSNYRLYHRHSSILLRLPAMVPASRAVIFLPLQQMRDSFITQKVCDMCLSNARQPTVDIDIQLKLDQLSEIVVWLRETNVDSHPIGTSPSFRGVSESAFKLVSVRSCFEYLSTLAVSTPSCRTNRIIAEGGP
jgi:hypothetical protein